MHTHYKTLLVFFLFLINNNGLFAQSFVFKNYSTKEGLPSSETYNSVQDESGYMWIATDRGVAKFDGNTFKIYTTDDGMPDNTIFEMFNDSKGRLWFKGFASLAGYFKKDSIYLYKYNHLIKSVLPFQLLINMIVDDEDNLWFSKETVLDNEIIIKINKNGQIDSSYNMGSSNTQKVFITKNGSYIVTGSLLAPQTEFYQLETNKKIITINHKGVNGGVLVAKMGTDTFISIIGKTVVKISENKSEKIWDCKTEVINVFVDKDKNIWIGYRERGYEFLSAKSNYTKAISGLGGQTVSSITQDNEGGIWLTTLENGVYYLSPKASISITKANGLVSNKINKIVEIKDKIFLIDGDKRLLKIDDKKSDNKIETLSSLHNYSDIAYRKGWGIFSFYPIEQHFSNIKNITFDFKTSIFIGQKYVYTVSPKAINKYNKTGEIIDSVFFNNLSRIWCVYEKSDTELFIGTLTGLLLYKNKKIIPLKDKNPLFGYRIKDIKQIDKKHVLVATIGAGILLVNLDDIYAAKQYKTAQGLPSVMCNVIYKENDTAIWVGTNNGLCLISNILDSAKSRFFNFDINDGLTSNEVNDVCKIENDLWVATASGITIINRNKFLIYTPAIPLYIKSVEINGEANYTATQPPIPYKNNNISISFMGINFQHANKLVYKYRLKNTENKWNYTKATSVVYSSLPAGKYVFEVGVVKPNGRDNPNYATYSFIILPPFWQTTWFMLAMLLITGGLVYLFIHGRINFVRRQEILKHDLNTYRDRALRRQMNPHFIYNSLNSIQNYILKNDAEASASFLAKFSQLMRLTFTNTAQETVTLQKEIEALLLYTELENLRFNKKFKLHINYSPQFDAATTKIPPLIIQPFVENAILHGLLTKPEKGNIWVDIKKHQGKIEIAIKDDGIGLKNAEKIVERKARFKNPFTTKNSRESTGITTTRARIQQIWGKNYNESLFKIVDLQLEEGLNTGTLVLFFLPIYD